MNGHSHIGASSAARWLACPGSVKLYNQLTERRATEYAARGTLAHELCEKCLLSGVSPQRFLGEVHEVDGFCVEVTEDMVDSVSVYVDHIRDELKEHGGKLVVEQSFDLSWVYPGMYGRNDASIIPDVMFGTLYVYDYKNGRVPVPAENNPQLMYYALGALGQHNDLFVERVVITIVQPNAMDSSDVIKKWEISTKELYAWAGNVLRPGAVRTEDTDPDFSEGEHCTFCEAAAFCPLKQQRVLAMLDTPADAPTNEIVLPPVQAIPPERIGMLSAFFNGPEFMAWCKSLAAEEQSMLARGVNIPGRKLVEKTVLGNRKWADEAAAVKAFADELGEEMFTIKSPAAVEKLLTAHGWNKKQRDELVSGLVTRSESIKVSVVSENDMAPAIAERREKAIELFNN